MPSYDYRCQKCRGDFTVERSMKDDSQQHCIHCNSEDTSRIWTVVAIASQGSTADYGQGTSRTSSTGARKSACGSCVSKNCGTCH